MRENEPSADNQQERLTTIPNHIAWYISGFVDGEGSFNISLRKKRDYRIGWQPILSFNVSQREKTVLDLIKKYFQCGIIKRRLDGLHSYDVTKPQDLMVNVVPFFEQYKFLSKRKTDNFNLFKQACQLMLKKKHLKLKGFIQLLNIRQNINQGKGRTRKYTKKKVMESLKSPETIRQA
jgi:hypothetical protein